MNKLMDMIEKAKTIVVLGHIRPDGDCVGSCLAIRNYILACYPQRDVQVYLETPPQKFSYLAGFDTISNDPARDCKYDLCICLDSGDAERLGDFKVYMETAKATICLDHHITNTGYAQENVINADASSTCEVIYQLLELSKITKEVAECIYTGILHDTNVFKNSNTSGKTMEIAGHMMDKGINFSQIIDESFYRKSYVQNQILGRALLESVTFQDGKCIFSVARRKDMDFYGVVSSDLDGIVDQLRITAGVEVAIFLHETENHVYKVSMRSNQAVDVSRVAAFFGGGGHVRAAGCTMGGSVYDVINNLSRQIEKQLKEQNA